MLKRVYIDNYKCFTNFTLELGGIQLIVGRNGTGKSALLEALRYIRSVAVEGVRPDDLTLSLARTRWEHRTAQAFELDVQIGQETFRYRLVLDERAKQPAEVIVAEERLSANDVPLVAFANGEVRLFTDAGSLETTYPFDPRRSVIGTLTARRGANRIRAFADWLARLYCLRLNPQAMDALSERESRTLADSGVNFASWYRHLSQESSPSQLSELQGLLGKAIDGFVSLRNPGIGQHKRVLQAHFQRPTSAAIDSTEPDTTSYEFGEISDGQRMLIVLYTVLQFGLKPGTTVAIDEPDNFVAIEEIQPWLQLLVDRAEDTGGQVILVSHHPELIDYFARDCGIRFARAGFDHVRAESYEHPAGSPLPPSELFARGWDGR